MCVCLGSLFNCKCCICCNKKLIQEQEKKIEQRIRELEILEQSIKRLEKIERLNKINTPYYGTNY